MKHVRLSEQLKARDSRMVAPLMGYPGINLTHTSIKQNEFNWGVQFWTISELVHEFRPDIAFFMMDLAVEASALGLPVRFPLLESPSVEYHMVKEVTDLQQFMACDVLKDGRARAYIETMKLMSTYLDVIPGAYCTGPFTLAGLMMGANDIALATVLDPDLVSRVLEVATSVIVRYVKALAHAGAKVVAVLEPTAVMLSPDAFRMFSGQYVAQIFRAVPGVVPVLHICGHSNHLFEEMAGTGAEAFSLDSPVDFPQAARSIPSDVVLIGNVNPVGVMRDGAPADVRAAVKALCEGMRPFSNFILSTGCDLPPDTPLENIREFMAAGRDYGRLK
jgi:uroporphyrinogen decarboxylase